MDSGCRRPHVLHKELRVLNQKAETERQQKLEQLEKQSRYHHKMLRQRRDSVLREHRQVVTVKVCEPKATVDVAMREINQSVTSETHVIRTSFGSRSRHEEVEAQTQSTSAPPPSVGSLVSHRGRIQSSVSLMQMKNIATIDSISEKERAWRQQIDQEETERRRRLQRETLHNRVQDFIQKLQDKANVDGAEDMWVKTKKP